MRMLSVNIGTSNVVFEKSMWTGREFVYVNGNLVSKKFSWFGAHHAFQVTEDGETVHYTLTTGYGWWGLITRLNRNGVLVVEAGYRSTSWM